MSKESAEKFERELCAHQSDKLGMNTLPVEQIAGAILNLMMCLPTERLNALALRWAASPSKLDQFRARELALILFAQKEIRDLPESLNPGDGLDILRDALLRNPLKPRS